jgi:hypothetical protein
MKEKQLTYFQKENEFIKYFERLRDTGMSFDEIQTKLPQLQDYYFDMVIKGVIYTNQPTLEGLFNKWKKYIS